MQIKQEIIKKDDIEFILSFIEQQSHTTEQLVNRNELNIKKMALAQLLTTCKQYYNAQTLFIAAVSENRIMVAKLLIKLKLVNPDDCDNEAICIASREGYTSIVKELLKYPEVNPGIKDNLPLYEATVNKHKEIVVCLLADKRVNPALNLQALHAACENEHYEIIKQFFAHQQMATISLEWLAHNNYVTAMNVILTEEHSRYISCHEISKAFSISIDKEYPEIVKLLLNNALYSPNNDFYDYDDDMNRIRSSPLNFACKKGHEKIVQLLLEDGRSDPTAENNLAINSAAKLGFINVIKVLLADGRVNPFEKDQKGWNAIKQAVKFGHIEIVMLFLRDSRANCKEVYFFALEEKQFPLIREMLKNNLIQPGDGRSALLRQASSDGDIEMVKELLTHPTIKPDANSSEAILTASAKGHLEIVTLLLNDKRAHPQTFKNLALRDSAKNGHHLVVKQLLLDERVYPGAMNNAALFSAIENNHIKIQELLFLDQRILQRGLYWVISTTSSQKQFTLLVERYESIIQSLREELDIKSLSTLMLWLLEGIQEIRENKENRYPDQQVILEQLQTVETILYQTIPFLAQNHYRDEAIRCWLLISSPSQYKEARFDAFQYAYDQYRKQSSKFEAFLYTLPYCFQKKGKLLNFKKKQQQIFDCYLLEASGIHFSPKQLKDIKFTAETRIRVIQYIVLIAVKNELLPSFTQTCNALSQMSPVYAKQGFFADEKKQGLISQLSKLPESLHSLADLNVLQSLLGDKENKSSLVYQTILNLNEITISNKNLKFLIGVLGKEPASKIDTLPANEFII